jgi:hypothetical protein
MEIIIEYESSWRNSFLEDGDGNNKPLPSKGRKYMACGQALGNSKNFHRREVTKDTVFGILSRLIGDQRKLYQARASKNYYFREIEDVMAWQDQAQLWNEIVYLRNMSGSDDQNSFTGSIKLNDPRLTSDYSQKLWGVLALTEGELIDFILDDVPVSKSIDLTPFSIIERLEEIQKIKPSDLDMKKNQAVEELKNFSEKSNPLTPKGQLKWIAIYCAALYLQIERLKKDFDIESATTKTGAISGISFNGFTKKDFLAKFTTTGVKKKVWGNPYIMKERVKGEGEKISMLQKARGNLTITLDLSKDKAGELKTMIDNAGVSSFYLGKKGLAYVTSIRV